MAEPKKNTTFYKHPKLPLLYDEKGKLSKILSTSSKKDT